MWIWQNLCNLLKYLFRRAIFTKYQSASSAMMPSIEKSKLYVTFWTALHFTIQLPLWFLSKYKLEDWKMSLQTTKILILFTDSSNGETSVSCWLIILRPDFEDTNRFPPGFCIVNNLKFENSWEMKNNLWLTLSDLLFSFYLSTCQILKSK